METLRQLRERSQLILLPGDTGNVPLIQRSLDQMEREMKKMRDNIKSTQELQAKAHYFLATNGIDTQHISTPIDTSLTFEISEADNHTDVKRFLEEEHEKILINIIEDQRKLNNDDFEKFFEQHFELFSKKLDGETAGQNENMMDYEEFEKVNNAAGLTRISDYANVVTQLNENRKKDTDFDLIHALANIKNTSELKRAQDSALDAWNMLNYLVSNSGVNGRLDGRFLKLITEPYNSKNAIDLRKQLISTSKSWLEKQTSQYINDTLDKNATKIQIGGIPSFTHRLKAFINLVFKTATEWIDDRLEIDEGLPIWAFVFLLMRTGHLDLAKKFVNDHFQRFSTEGKFVAYFNEYMEAKDHCVSKVTREAILADYNRFAYGERVVDPYKIIIYKIIGRCELHIKSLPDTIKTTEDYIWLQLTLIRETTEEPQYEYENYRLVDVQSDILLHGSTYFDREESNPWIFFKVLLVTLQFEKAIEFLYHQKRLRLEAVHFTIALYYYGLLRVTATPTHSILMNDESIAGLFSLNIEQLIYQYTQVYLSTDLSKALQYLCLLNLYSPEKGYPHTDMVNVAISCVCKLVMATGDFKSLLGFIENDRMPGLIEKQASLLNIDKIEDYTEKILHPIAEQCIQIGRCRDAVYVYSLSSNYSKMMQVLAKEMSDALQQPQSFRMNDPTLSDLTNNEIIQFSTYTLEHYEKFKQFSAEVQPRERHTVRTLIDLLRFRDLYETQQYVQALQVLELVNIIPFTDDFNQLQNLVNQFGSLDETIRKNIPEILLNTMDILYKIWCDLTSNPSVPGVEIENIEKKVRVILTFVALIQIYIPNDIIIRLNKADMLMSIKRQ